MNEIRTLRRMTAIALVLVAFAVSACASDTLQPRSTAPELSPSGSRYTVRLTGSGFAADIVLQRSVPDASGASPLAAAAYIDSGTDSGGFNKLVVEDVPLAIEAAAADGQTQNLPATPTSTVTHEAYLDLVFDDLTLPASAESVTLTLHLGRTASDAETGASVTVPVSAIPAVETIESANRTGSSPAF